MCSQVPESSPFWASLLANVGWFCLTTPQCTFTCVHPSHLLGGDSPVWLRTHRLVIPLLTLENQSHARGKCCHSRTREERSCTAMNTQLLRYNVLTEHLTFPPIPPATRDFGRTGRTHRLQATRLRRRQAERKRAQTGLLSKVKRRTRRAPEPGRWAAVSHLQKQTCVIVVSLSQISESMVKCIYNSHTI